MDTSLFLAGYDFFKEQSGSEPERRVVQADHSPDVISGMAVIPGTGVVPFQQEPREKLSCKNTASIYQAPDQKILFPENPAQRSEKTGHPIDREHPDRSARRQTVFTFPQGTKPRKYDLHAPSQDAACNKFLPHHKRKYA